MIEPDNEKVLFVIRRAFRSPQRLCTRKDVLDALELGPARASQILNEAAATNNLLKRTGNGVSAPEWLDPPPWADENDLMEALEAGDFRFARTGLRIDGDEAELPINVTNWREKRPAAPGALEHIVRCITTSKSLYIKYVSMRLGSNGDWRRIVPLSLDQLDGQWRVFAHDLELPDPKIKSFEGRTFALTRIIDFKHDTGKTPKFSMASPVDTHQTEAVEIGGMFTEAQRKALENEFKIRGGCVRLPARSKYEFQRAFVDADHVKEDLAWPPFVRFGSATSRKTD